MHRREAMQRWAGLGLALALALGLALALVQRWRSSWCCGRPKIGWTLLPAIESWLLPGQTGPSLTLSLSLFFSGPQPPTYLSFSQI